MLKQPRIENLSVNGLGATTGEWIAPAQRSQRMWDNRSFCFLNETHELVTSSDWNHHQWSKLWLYNLHYFDDLTSCNADQRMTWHRSLIDYWIKENPLGQGNGWEPYPSSLRIVNWIKWALAGNVLQEHWIQSLAVQARYLYQNIESHLLGNHLFANAKALMFAGLFIDSDDSSAWYETGSKLLKRELPEQVLDDGGNFELSPMYHQIFLEDLLDLLNLHSVYNHLQPEGLLDKIPKMYRWLEVMCHSDNEISFFNDSALDVTPSVQELQEYGSRLGVLNIVSTKKDHRDLVVLAESGYARVKWDEALALIDRAAVGPDYLPAHAHADTLSFELSLFGQRFIVNSGTSVYGTGPDRMQQRSTAAHSTVVIDDQDSSEVWAGFRVARRARVYACVESRTEKEIRLAACHDGYKRLSGKPVHYREWLFDQHRLTITDSITGRGVHSIKSVLPLHPKVKIKSVEKNQVLLNILGNEISLTIQGKGKLEVIDSSYHPEFGLSIENKQLVFSCNEFLPVKIQTRISW